MTIIGNNGEWYVFVKREGKNFGYKLSEVIGGIDSTLREDHLKMIIDNLMFYGKIKVTIEIAFSFLIYSSIMQEVEVEELTLEPLWERLVKKLSTEYCRNSDNFPRFNQAFRGILLRLLSTPLLAEDEDNKIIHATETEALSEAVRIHLAKIIPRFKAAQSGFMNVAKFALLGKDAKFEDSYNFKIASTRVVSFDELSRLLDYYLSFDFFKKRKQREKTLKEIFELCMDSEICQEFFVGYYEKHKDLFRPAFLEFPQYKFIAGDRFKVYRSFDFFPIVDKRRGNCKKKGTGGGSGYKFDIAENQDNLNGALGMIIHDIEAAGLEYRLINFWPTERLNVVIDEEEVSPYVAVAVEANQRWHILVDGNTIQSAIYYVVGDDFDKLLDIFLLTKKNAKQREGVQHKNHNRNGGAEAYYAKYRALMSDILAR